MEKGKAEEGHLTGRKAEGKEQVPTRTVEVLDSAATGAAGPPTSCLGGVSRRLVLHPVPNDLQVQRNKITAAGSQSALFSSSALCSEANHPALLSPPRLPTLHLRNLPLTSTAMTCCRREASFGCRSINHAFKDQPSLLVVVGASHLALSSA